MLYFSSASHFKNKLPLREKEEPQHKQHLVAGPQRSALCPSAAHRLTQCCSACGYLPTSSSDPSASRSHCCLRALLLASSQFGVGVRFSDERTNETPKKKTQQTFNLDIDDCSRDFLFPSHTSFAGSSLITHSPCFSFLLFSLSFCAFFFALSSLSFLCLLFASLSTPDN